MKIIFKNKTKTTAFTLFLAASMLLLIAVAPTTTNAQVINRQITLFISAEPSPVGMGQSVQILCWADIYPNEYVPQNITNPIPGGPALVGAITYATWNNYTFTITRPDGTTDVRVFPTTDPLGSAYFTYAPTQIGTYTVKCHFPGESFAKGVTTVSGGPSFIANASFDPAGSQTISFVVQQQPAFTWSYNSLPSGYWSRPIDAQNRFWGSITSNWLSLSQGTGENYWTNYQPYGGAPTTAHVLWNKVWQNGGVVSGDTGVNEYYTGESYQGKFRPIVLDGRLYASLKVGSAVTRGFICYDLATGKELFERNDTTVTSGFDFSLQWEDAHGTIDFLIGSPIAPAVTGLGTTMNFYDPLNGERCFTIENVTLSGGAIIMNNTAGAGETNDMNIYYLTGNRLIVWSFWKCVAPLSGFSWAPSPTVNYNWAKGIEYNVSIPAPSMNGVQQSGSYSISSLGGLVDGTIAVARSVNTTVWPPMLYLIGIRCTDGSILWTSNTSVIPNVAVGNWRGGGGVALDSADGVFLNYKQETFQVVGFNLATGTIQYTTIPRNGSNWAMYSSGWSIDSAYGMFYVGTYDGYMMAYDAKTGTLEWQYYDGNAGTVTPYGTWPFFMGIPYGMTIGGGEIFAPTGEHSPNDPLYPGEALHVINANTGQQAWQIQGWWLANSLADGYYTAYNGYDGEIYTFGKGLSATTIATSPAAVTAGSTVTITGTITDQSPGQTCLGVPAAGTPAISDDSMTPWMQYLYMQDPMPTNATGVQVQLVAIDSSGASTTIGTATSDITGFYNTHWTVPITPGDYKIVANFAGTNSYFSSSAVAAITVVAAAPTQTPLTASDLASQVVSQLPVQTPVPTAPSASDVASQVVSQLPGVDNTLLYAAIAIGVIIAILVAVNIVISLRKRQQ